MEKRVVKAKNNAWERWQRKYTNSLMQSTGNSQRTNRKLAKAPWLWERQKTEASGRNGRYHDNLKEKTE